MRALKTLSAWTAAATVVCLAALTTPSCGQSDLTKAYEAYDASVAPLLDRDKPVWTKTVALFNEQLSEETANRERFADCLSNEAAPFYAELASKLPALAPADPALAPAHESLVKYAASRAAFVRYLMENLEVLNPAASTEALSYRQGVAQAAVEEYQAATRGAVVVDPRFGALTAAEKSYGERCMKPFSEGRMSENDVREFIRQNLLPPIQALRNEKFADDEPSQLLRKAIVAAQEFYEAVAENLPLVDRNVRFGAEVTRLTAEGDEIRKKFLEEMAAVRKRM